LDARRKLDRRSQKGEYQNIHVAGEDRIDADHQPLKSPKERQDLPEEPLFLAEMAILLLGRNCPFWAAQRIGGRGDVSILKNQARCGEIHAAAFVCKGEGAVELAGRPGRGGGMLLEGENRLLCTKKDLKKVLDRSTKERGFVKWGWRRWGEFTCAFSQKEEAETPGGDEERLRGRLNRRQKKRGGGKAGAV